MAAVGLLRKAIGIAVPSWARELFTEATPGSIPGIVAVSGSQRASTPTGSDDTLSAIIATSRRYCLVRKE